MFAVWGTEDGFVNIAAKTIFLAFGIIWALKAAVAFGYVIQV